MNIEVCKNPDDLAQEAVDLFLEIALDCLDVNDKFTVVLAGGSTPKRMYQLLSIKYLDEPEWRKEFWSKVFIFWGDERFVPYTNPESNYGVAYYSLLQFLPIPQENIFRIPTEGISPDEAAFQYSKTVSDFFAGKPPDFDLMILGMGQDGHTASLFPHSPTLHAKGVAVAEKHSPKPPLERVTLTYETINNAKEILVMVSGTDKAKTVKEVLEGEKRPDNLPIQGIDHKGMGFLNWYMDEAAASELTKIPKKSVF